MSERIDKDKLIRFLAEAAGLTEWDDEHRTLVVGDGWMSQFAKDETFTHEEEQLLRSVARPRGGVR